MKKSKFLAIALIFSFACSSMSAFAQRDDDVRPSAEQVAQEKVKMKAAEAYVKEKRKGYEKYKEGDIVPAAAGSSKVNPVGTDRQTYSYSCGPMSARNLISGYKTNNNLSITVPSETTLMSNLGTNSTGTGFDANPWQNTLNTYAPGNNYTLCWGSSTGWSAALATKVINTIDKTSYWQPYGQVNGFNVVGDMYYTTQISNPVHSVYAKPVVKHYICIYGYDDVNKKYNISDSNSAAPVTYTTPYTNAAAATQGRGVIW